MEIHEYDEGEKRYERDLSKFQRALEGVGSFLISGIGDFNYNYEYYPTRERFGELFEIRNALNAKKIELRERRKKWNL